MSMVSFVLRTPAVDICSAASHPQLLRVVPRPPALPADELRRPDRRARGRRLVPEHVLDRDGDQSPDDAHGGRALRVRVQVQRRQARRLLAELHRRHQVRRHWVQVRPGPTPRSCGLHPRHAQEFFAIGRSAYFTRLRQAIHQPAVPRDLESGTGDHVPAAASCAPPPDRLRRRGERRLEVAAVRHERAAAAAGAATSAFAGRRRAPGKWNLEPKEAPLRRGVRTDADAARLARTRSRWWNSPTSPTPSTSISASRPGREGRAFIRGVPGQARHDDGRRTILVTTASTSDGAHGCDARPARRLPVGLRRPQALHARRGRSRRPESSRKVAIQIAREWAETAEKTRGQVLIIAGAGHCTGTTVRPLTSASAC